MIKAAVAKADGFKEDALRDIPRAARDVAPKESRQQGEEWQWQ